MVNRLPGSVVGEGWACSIRIRRLLSRLARGMSGLMLLLGCLSAPLSYDDHT
jgi:hypothetical protein